MLNKVGNKVPSAKVVGALREKIGEVKGVVLDHGVIVSKEERKAQSRARHGYEAMADRVFDLATRYNVVIPDVSLDGMKDDIALQQALEPIREDLASTLTVVEHTLSQAESEAWQAYLAYYTALSAMATRVPQLAHELKPVTELMANGKRTPKAPSPTPDKKGEDG